jgi:hypothetical protein
MGSGLAQTSNLENHFLFVGGYEGTMSDFILSNVFYSVEK